MTARAWDEYLAYPSKDSLGFFMSSKPKSERLLQEMILFEPIGDGWMSEIPRLVAYNGIETS